MALNMNKLTEKAQEAVAAAQQLAEERHHTQLEPEHLLRTLVAQEDGVVPAILERLGLRRGRRPGRGRCRPRWPRPSVRADAGVRLEPVSPGVRGGPERGRTAKG